MYGDASWCDWVSEDKTILLGCVYRSSSSTDSCDTILNLLSIAANQYDCVLITGDFNLKDIDWETYTTSHSEMHHEYKFTECLRDNYLFQHVKHFTRCRENQAKNILDFILTKDENNVHIIEILPSLGCSDHITLSFEFLCSYKELNTEIGRYRYTKCDLKSFPRDLNDVDWEEEFKNMDIEEMLKFLSSKFNALVDKHVLKSVPRKGSKPKPLWMKGILKHIKLKRHAWNKYLATRRQRDFEEYKLIRNITNDFAKPAKRNRERLISTKAKTEPKHFWQYVQKKTKSKISVHVVNLEKPDGSHTINDQEKAVLNDFFTKVFTSENLTNKPDIEDK